MSAMKCGSQEIGALADIVGDVVGSATPEGERLLAAIEELGRLRIEAEMLRGFVHNAVSAAIASDVEMSK